MSTFVVDIEAKWGMRASKKSVAKAWTQLGKYFREGMEALEKEEEEKRRDGGE